MYRLLFPLFVCLLWALSVCGGQQVHDPNVPPRYAAARLPTRDTRQTNRYPTNGGGEDHFSGLDPMAGNGNYEYTSTERPYNPYDNQNYEYQPENSGAGNNNDRQTSTVVPTRQTRPTRPRPTNNRPNQGTTSTTAPSNSSAGDSAVLNSCNADCKTKVVMEYNPVCGSNEVTYQNVRFLRCVAECSRLPITMSYVGKCPPVVSQ